MSENTSKKVWKAEETSNLIEAYRNIKCLWDAKHADYKNRIKKKDALVELGKMFHVSAAEVERKLANINSQYRRERRNYKKFKKSGAASFFRPKWFGYNLMAFLRDKNKPRRTEESGLDESSLMEVNSDTSSGEETESVVNEETIISTDQDGHVNDMENETANEVEHDKESEVPLSTPKRKEKPAVKEKSERKEKPATKSESAEVLDMMRNIYQMRKTTPAVDEFQLFGDLMATKIRNLKTPYARSTIQNKISNLLYEAEIGTYDVPLLDNTFPTYPHLTTIGNNGQYSNPPSVATTIGSQQYSDVPSSHASVSSYIQSPVYNEQF